MESVEYATTCQAKSMKGRSEKVYCWRMEARISAEVKPNGMGEDGEKGRLWME